LDLAQFFLKYPEVSLANSVEVDEKVRTFFHQAPMTGKGMQLLYWREPSFKAFLDCHSDRSFVFYVESTQGQIEGAGTIVIRPAMVNGKREMVGYLGDLRVDNIRRWGRYWRDFYLDLMKAAPHIEEFGGARFFYTAILHQNTKARKALGESKIGYHSFHQYQMVNVLRQWAPVKSKFAIKTWDDLPLAQIEDFYRTANLGKPLGWVVDETYSEVQWRLKNWHGFKKSDAFVLSDKSGIVISAAFWSPSPLKKIIVKQLPREQKILLNLLGAVQRMPREGEELRCLYLTSLDRRPGLSEKDWQHGMRQLVKIGLELARERGFHCLSLAEFGEEQFSLWPFIALKTKLELYFVDPINNPSSEFSRAIPGFEMGLV
jgi:hypothetical protein